MHRYNNLIFNPVINSLQILLLLFNKQDNIFFNSIGCKLGVYVYYSHDISIAISVPTSAQTTKTDSVAKLLYQLLLIKVKARLNHYLRTF